MQARTEELLRHLEQHRATLRAAVEGVPEDRRGESPEPGRWSVAEVLEHLTMIERAVTQIFAARAAEGERHDPDAEPGSVVDTIDMAFLLDRSRKIETPESRRPTGRLEARAAWAELESARRGLVEAIVGAEDRALDRVMHNHPLVGPLNLYQWVVFVGGHEARHAAQIVEIGESLAGRAPESTSAPRS
jgi:hypothetical protein